MTLFDSLKGWRRRTPGPLGRGRALHPADGGLREGAFGCRFARGEARRRSIGPFIAESRASMATAMEPETGYVVEAIRSRGEGLSMVSERMRERIAAMLLRFGIPD